MNRHKQYQHEQQGFFEPMNEDSTEELAHKRQVRRKIEDKIEMRRLMKEIEAFEGDFDSDLEDRFDWDDFQR